MKGTCQYCGFVMQRGRMSRNSSGFFCKSDLRCFNRLLFRSRRAEAKMEKILPVAQRMANVMYNISQLGRFAEHDQNICRDLYAQWDKAVKS